ncbi:hypothetical protein SK128_023583 [Halocaridina rubra]|uniref:CHK kinase-like domain-containing protein n=1 Tax=Halocaridina rubra TaxID=373956 RepID=A0AAN8WDZ7_HALRR
MPPRGGTGHVGRLVEDFHSSDITMDMPVEVHGSNPHSLITQEHVLSVLQADKGTDAKLISWVIEDFTKKGDNMATFVTSVTVNYFQGEKKGKVSYVVKLNPCRSGAEFNAIAVKLFIKESKFYCDFVPALNSVLKSAGQPPLRVPNCFYFTLETGEEAIFLEDLRPRGFRMTETGFQGTDFAHTMLLMREIARLHAASWALQRKRPEQDLGERFNCLTISFMEGPDLQYLGKIMTRGIGVAILMLEHIGGYDKVVDWANKHRTSSTDVMCDMLRSSPPFDVACHGDMHINNLLFRYNDEGEPIEIMLLDHQANRVASMATDLNYFLFLNLTGDVRKPNLDTLLRTYFNTFKQVVEGSGEILTFSFEEFRQEFVDKHRFGLIYALFVAPILIQHVDDFPDAEELFQTTSEEISEEEKVNILKALDANHALRKKFLAVYDEMLETGLFD